MDEKQREKLTMLVEECGEVIQATTKTLRHGLSSHHPEDPTRETNEAALQREFEDLLAVAEQCGLRIPRMDTRIKRWTRKLPYTHHQGYAKTAERRRGGSNTVLAISTGLGALGALKRGLRDVGKK